MHHQRTMRFSAQLTAGVKTTSPWFCGKVTRTLLLLGSDDDEFYTRGRQGGMEPDHTREELEASMWIAADEHRAPAGW